jgi:hypothetical protein
MTSTPLRRLATALLVAAAAVTMLSGCSRPAQADGDRVAEWIAQQRHVSAAEASVSTDPWSPGVDFRMTVDAAISNDELARLAAAAERRARDAGWPEPYLVWDVGADRSFSNGDGAALQIFIGMRDDPRFLVASARGTGECGYFYCVTIRESDPETLHEAVVDLLALAEQAGGVQENLDFTAVSADGDFSVTARPDAPSDASVELWARLAGEVPIDSARAWVVGPVGDLPAGPILHLEVPDEAARAAAETLAATRSAVELDIAITRRGAGRSPGPSGGPGAAG